MSPRTSAASAASSPRRAEFPPPDTFLLPPAAAIPAFRHGEREWKIGDKTVHYLDAWSYTEWFELLGNPAAVVPVSESQESFPIGVEIVGRPWEEQKVLTVASALEPECAAWRTRRFPH